jgi:transcription elongation factor Elf1
VKVKFSAKFEGKCDVCGKKGIAFTVGDEDSKKAVTICEKCVNKGEITDSAELIEKYGKVDEAAFSPAVKYMKKPTAG